MISRDLTHPVIISFRLIIFTGHGRHDPYELRADPPWSDKPPPFGFLLSGRGAELGEMVKRAICGIADLPLLDVLESFDPLGDFFSPILIRPVGRRAAQTFGQFRVCEPVLKIEPPLICT